MTLLSVSSRTIQTTGVTIFLGPPRCQLGSADRPGDNALRTQIRTSGCCLAVVAWRAHLPPVWESLKYFLDAVVPEAERANENPAYSSIGRLFAIGYIKGLREAVYRQK